MKIAISMIAAVMGLMSMSAFASGGYSALAYDSASGHWGRWQGAYTQADAIAGAINACQSNPGSVNCQPVGYACDGYVVLAVGAGNHYGTGALHDTQANAEQASMAACSSVTSACAVKVEAYAYGPCY